MAKDDYFVLVYRILSYLYECLKSGQCASLEYLVPDTGYFPINKTYWDYIFEHLYNDGYIEGVTLFSILGKSTSCVKISPDVRIAPKGIEYFQENSAMQRAREFLKN